MGIRTRTTTTCEWEDEEMKRGEKCDGLKEAPDSRQVCRLRKCRGRRDGAKLGRRGGGALSARHTLEKLNITLMSLSANFPPCRVVAL